jgi:diguanylate cyclase (GGDEF)-like protein
MSGARTLAEKLRLKIADNHFKKVNELTVSFGVVAFDQNDDVLTLVKRVDDALYQAKENGRNRVETLDAAANAAAANKPRTG